MAATADCHNNVIMVEQGRILSRTVLHSLRLGGQIVLLVSKPTEGSDSWKVRSKVGPYQEVKRWNLPSEPDCQHVKEVAKKMGLQAAEPFIAFCLPQLSDCAENAT